MQRDVDETDHGLTSLAPLLTPMCAPARLPFLPSLERIHKTKFVNIDAIRQLMYSSLQQCIVTVREKLSFLLFF